MMTVHCVMFCMHCASACDVNNEALSLLHLPRESLSYPTKGKAKAIPLQARCGPEGG